MKPTCIVDRLHTAMCGRRHWMLVCGMLLGFSIGMLYEFSDYTERNIKVVFPEEPEPGISNEQTLKQIKVTDTTDTTASSTISLSLDRTKPEVKKVLLLTYMRGGSSLLGELFNQNEAASYWFEPVDGMYSDMYGTSHGWFPIDIQFNTGGTPRYIGHDEETRVVNYIKDIYDCNITALPIDVLSNYQMMHIQQKRNADYIACVNKNIADAHIKHSWGCKSTLRKYCPRYFEPGNSSLASCAYVIAKYKTTFIANINKLNVKLPNNLASKSSFIDKFFANPFASHRMCTEKSKTVVDRYCSPGLQNVCESSNIIAIKAIRLRADTVFRLMQEIPNLHVVHYVRDPRGVVTSRSNTKLISETAKRLPGFSDPLVNEAKLLCQRMSTDHSLMTKLDILFPGQVMTLRYEDFVTNVESVAEKMYKSFLNQAVPQSLTKWFSGALTGQNRTKTKTAAAYDTYRKNPAATASRWRGRLSPLQQSEMTAVCDDVLNAFGYT